MHDAAITLKDLQQRDRHLLADLAASAGVSPATYGLTVIEAYFTLLRDAPAALPPCPLAGLSSRAQSKNAAR